MRDIRFFSLFLTIILAAGCSGTSSPDVPETAAPATEPAPGPSEPAPGPSEPAPAPKVVPANGSKGCGLEAKAGSSNGAIDVAGTERTYILSLPKAYDPFVAYPVIFVLHSGGGTGASARAYFAFDAIGVEENAIVLYPDAIAKNWDLETPAATNKDVALFDALVNQAKTTTCIDASRIFATGTSQGAYLTNQLGCRRGDVLRGIAPHAGGGPFETSGGKWDAQGHLMTCVGSPAAMVFIGLADTNVQPSEGEKSVSHWSWENGCKAQSSPIAPTPCVAYDGCSKPVEVCRLPGVTHKMWSEGPKATWEFFSKL